MLEQFLYFDQDGIESLFNQNPKGGLQRYTTEEASGGERGFTGKMKVGIGGMLKFLSVPSLDSEAEGGIKKTYLKRRSEEFATTKESRYNDVIDRLGGVSALRRNLNDAWHRALAADFGDLFICEAMFSTLLTSAEGDGWRLDANTSGVLQLRSFPDRAYTMGMSIEKLSSIKNGSILLRSHLSVRMQNEPVYLRVFGKMDRSRYINPYVVSW